MKPRDKMEIGARVSFTVQAAEVTGYNDQNVTVRLPREWVQVIEPLPEPGIYVAADGLAVHIGTDETKDTLRRVMDHHGPLHRLTRMPTRADVEAALNVHVHGESLWAAGQAVMDLLTRSQP